MLRKSKENGWMVVVGLVGCVALLAGSLVYALFDSGTYYESEQINDLVLRQSTDVDSGR